MTPITQREAKSTCLILLRKMGGDIHLAEVCHSDHAFVLAHSDVSQGTDVNVGRNLKYIAICCRPVGRLVYTFEGTSQSQTTLVPVLVNFVWHEVMLIVEGMDGGLGSRHSA